MPNWTSSLSTRLLRMSALRYLIQYIRITHAKLKNRCIIHIYVINKTISISHTRWVSIHHLKVPNVSILSGRVYIYIYIYICSERERHAYRTSSEIPAPPRACIFARVAPTFAGYDWRVTGSPLYIYIYICMYIYICIYIYIYI